MKKAGGEAFYFIIQIKEKMNENRDVTMWLQPNGLKLESQASKSSDFASPPLRPPYRDRVI